MSDEDELIKQAKQIRKRLSDMRVQNGLSPYDDMPDAVRLAGEISPYFLAIDLVLATELCGCPNPTFPLETKKRKSPKPPASSQPKKKFKH